MARVVCKFPAGPEVVVWDHGRKNKDNVMISDIMFLYLIMLNLLKDGLWCRAKTIKKNTNSIPNKSQTHHAKQYKVTLFLSTDCELSTYPCSKCLYSLGPWATTRGQEARLEVNETRILRWMWGVTRRDKTRNAHIRGTTRVVQASKKITEKRLKWDGHVRRMQEEHIIEKNVGCGHTGKKKKRAAKPKMERRMQERHDRGGSERGQDNKQGSMEEYHHQLYRRPQMTGRRRNKKKNLLKESYALHAIQL